MLSNNQNSEAWLPCSTGTALGVDPLDQCLLWLPRVSTSKALELNLCRLSTSYSLLLRKNSLLPSLPSHSRVHLLTQISFSLVCVCVCVCFQSKMNVWVAILGVVDAGYFSAACGLWPWRAYWSSYLSHRRVNLKHSSYLYDSSHKVIQTTTILPAHHYLSTRFPQCRNFT